MTDGVESRMLRAAMSRAMARTDREMLELAANAFWGADIDDCCSVRWLEDEQAIGYTHADNQDHNGEDREFVWNPLADDGDALRLANKLWLEIRHVHGAAHAGIKGEFWSTECWFPDGDQDAATRRAIVRAAAEVGRMM